MGCQGMSTYESLTTVHQGGVSLLSKEKQREHNQKAPEDAFIRELTYTLPIADWKCGKILQWKQTIWTIHKHCDLKNAKNDKCDKCLLVSAKYVQPCNKNLLPRRAERLSTVWYVRSCLIWFKLMPRKHVYVTTFSERERARKRRRYFRMEVSLSSHSPFRRPSREYTRIKLL